MSTAPRSEEVRARVVQARRVLERAGTKGLALRAVRRVERRLGTPSADLGLHTADIADLETSRRAAPPERVDRGRPLRVGWISTPPGAGSGGHTTMFRMVAALERAGHQCVLYLYDAYDGDVAVHAARVRQHWPRIGATVRDVRDGLDDADVWVATSWQTAHVLASRPEVGGHRFYFVQDYEPWFYPRGSEYALAESTYEFGFHAITAGSFLAGLLRARFGSRCDSFEFGADTDVYRLADEREPDGVVFYAKPSVPRRAFTVGMEALSRFSALRPEVPIHLFGEPVPGLPAPFVSHGTMTPEALARLYGTCRAGLSLSTTNVSLIPWELLACGVVPVVNDAEHNRQVLQNECVQWTPMDVGALARGLVAAYERGGDPRVAGECAASVAAASWETAGNAVVEVVEGVAYR